MFANLCNTHLFRSRKLNYGKYTHTLTSGTHTNTHCQHDYSENRVRTRGPPGAGDQSAYIAKPKESVPTQEEKIVKEFRAKSYKKVQLLMSKNIYQLKKDIISYVTFKILID